MKYGYPLDKTPKAIDIVMKQTKLMCSNEVIYSESVGHNPSEYRFAHNPGECK